MMVRTAPDSRSQMGHIAAKINSRGLSQISSDSSAMAAPRCNSSTPPLTSPLKTSAMPRATSAQNRVLVLVPSGASSSIVAAAASMAAASPA